MYTYRQYIGIFTILIRVPCGIFPERLQKFIAFKIASFENTLVLYQIGIGDIIVMSNTILPCRTLQVKHVMQDCRWYFQMQDSIIPSFLSSGPLMNSGCVGYALICRLDCALICSGRYLQAKWVLVEMLQMQDHKHFIRVRGRELAK